MVNLRVLRNKELATGTILLATTSGNTSSTSRDSVSRSIGGPNETALEETYYFRMKDPRGFALQRVYTADRSLDESLAAGDGDLVLVPRGYHTVSAAPGYDTYYLNVMAGPRREWKITFDPDHERMRW